MFIKIIIHTSNIQHRPRNSTLPFWSFSKATDNVLNERKSLTQQTRG